MENKLQPVDQLEREILHSPFHPLEVRDQTRLMSAQVKLANTWVEARIVRYSPYGIELVLPPLVNVAVGKQCALTVKFGNDEVTFDSVPIATIIDETLGKVAGFRITEYEKRWPPTTERRSTLRWALLEKFLPTGTAPNPLLIDDQLIFRVDDISARGMRLITSLRNKMVHKEMRLDATISFPLVGTYRIPLQIENAHVVAKDTESVLALGCSFVKADRQLLKKLAEYLLNFGKDVTLTQLEEAGFDVSGELKTLDFGHVRSRADYEKVLELRRLFIGNDQGAVGDLFDARSRIVTVKNGERIVASGRVLFPSNLSDCELASRGVQGAPELDFAKSAELSWICSHPEFKGMDLTRQIVTQSCLAALMAGRRFLFAAIEPRHSSFFKSQGFKSVKTVAMAPQGQQAPSVMRLDLERAILGRGLFPSAWAKTYRTLYAYLLEIDAIKPNLFDRAKLKLFQWLA